jgi:hypothetical protein
MSDLQRLQQALTKVARRQRLQAGMRGAWNGLFLGALVWLTGLLLYKLAPVPVFLLLAAGILGVVCVVAGFLFAFARRPTLPETARRVDLQQHLDERLSTALEFSETHSDSDWCRLLLAEAAGRVDSLDARRLLPWRLPFICRWTLLALALTAGLGFVPEYRSKAFVQKQRDAENIKATGQTLASLAQRALATHPPVLEPVRDRLQSIEELGQQLALQPLTRAEALRDLSSVAEKLKDELKQLGQDPALKRLEQSARQNGGTTASAEMLQQQMEALQKSLGNENATPDKLGELKSKLEQLQKQAAGLPAKDSPNGAQARQELAQSLSALAQQLRDLGQALEGLDEAIAALAADQTSALAQGLSEALTDLDQLKQQAQTLQQLQQQAARLGKDLAEQLKNGQAEAAAETLSKMAKQLQAANLSPEQLQQLSEEVRKAVDPAGEYGAVKELLQQAARQMQQGQRSGAGESLAAAEQELRKLLEQLGDAQSLASLLEALERAQLAVASGQGMGACRARGIGEEWAGWPGGSGAGLGTNPDDVFGQGEVKLPENLDPTRLRGQFTPGAPMPSITLKGVSIKGTSNVKFEEAAAAAQTDAQNALNQDQVPRAYKNAVREYFDDLKK